MTAVAIAILDRDDFSANTDVIVVADDRRRRLTWVPRDLWSPLIANRVNKAFALGGGDLLLRALAGLRFPCSGALVLRRSATEAALDGVTVVVPVSERLDFWYPEHPTRPIEDGRKAIAFDPPQETLRGERIHQWLGARTMIGRPGSDLMRCDRQQVFLRALMAQGFDFRASLADPERYRITGVDPLPVLGRITADWEMRTFRRVRDAIVDGKAVLVLERRLRRAVSHLRQPA
ncbi:MAG: hypothetical protein KIS68_03330 [Bauldia sp.]|nr:hypothetical protein [Bauldia sp.]